MANVIVLDPTGSGIIGDYSGNLKQRIVSRKANNDDVIIYLDTLENPIASGHYSDFQKADGSSFDTRDDLLDYIRDNFYYSGSGGGTVTSDDISDATAVGKSVLTAADAAAARTAIGIEEAEAVADATDETDVVAQFNALTASLRSAGILAAS